MIVQSSPIEGEKSALTFTIPKASLDHSLDALNKRKDEIGFDHIIHYTDVVKVSVVGVGMRSNPGVAAKMFETLAERRINIFAISTSEIKISVIVDMDYAELAVRVLHTAYGLDAEDEA
jgi:aspartate kinase